MKQITIKQCKMIKQTKIEVIIPSFKGVLFEEGLMRAKVKNRNMVSNRRLSQVIPGSEEWTKLANAGLFTCWSGTFVAYTQPGKPLGKSVESVDNDSSIRWIFPIPVEHRKRKDILILAEHPDYEIQSDGKNRIIVAAKVALIENFPTENGWYKYESVHGIPIQAELSTSDHFEFLAGLHRRVSYVGPLARNGSNDVYLNCSNLSEYALAFEKKI